MKSISITVFLLLAAATLAFSPSSAGEPAGALPPDFTAGGKKDDSHDWLLGPTGLHGWMFFRHEDLTAASRQILVTAVLRPPRPAVRHAIGLLIVLTSLLGAASLPTASAQSTTWSEPIKFYEAALLQSPVLVKDSGGNLHMFWAAALEENQPRALYYSRWDGAAWTEPVDVIVSPDGLGAWPANVWLDDSDFIHALWPARNGNLWQSKVHASEAADARKWDEPWIVVGDDSVRPSDEQVVWDYTVVAKDAMDILHLVYTNSNLNSVRTIRSKDGGLTWEGDTPIHLESRPDIWVWQPGILVAPDGALWAWWAELDASADGRRKGGAYARSTDGGQTWGQSEVLARGYYAGWFRIIGSTMLRLIAGGIGTGGRLVSFSDDSGNSWSDPVDISREHGYDGMEGIDVAVDSAGIWHFVEQSQGFATVAWDGRTWSPPESIISSEALESCCVTPGKTTQYAVTEISDGNRMHVFFTENDRKLWYTSRLLDAPSVAARPAKGEATVATPPATATSPILKDAALVAQSTPAPQATPSGDISGQEAPVVGAWHGVAFGATPAVLLVLVVVLIRMRHLRRR